MKWIFQFKISKTVASVSISNKNSSLFTKIIPAIQMAKYSWENNTKYKNTYKKRIHVNFGWVAR